MQQGNKEPHHKSGLTMRQHKVRKFKLKPTRKQPRTFDRKAIRTHLNK